MTEIGDGLHQIHVPAVGGDPVAAVAHALNGKEGGGVPASNLLAVPVTRSEEEALFLGLARAYAEVTQSDTSRWQDGARLDQYGTATARAPFRRNNPSPRREVA